MDPLGSGPGPSADTRMSIAYLAPARRDSSPSRPRPPPTSTSSFADAHGGPATRPTASSQGFRSILPPGFNQTRGAGTRQDEEEDVLNSSFTRSSLGDGNEEAETPTSASRDPRPTYTEEQKFFIMWARIAQEKCWPDIEKDFTRIWGVRTKGGLTSVYYRIRKSWKLKDVLSTDAGSSEADRQAVAERAKNFSGEFLRIIGYGLETMDYLMNTLRDVFQTG